VEDVTQKQRTTAQTLPTVRERQALQSWLILVLRQTLISIVTIAGVFALAFLMNPGDFALYGYASTAMLLAATVGDLGLGAGLIRFGVTDERLQASFGLQLAFWFPVCTLIGLLVVTVDAYPFPAGVEVALVAAFFLLALQALPTALLERRLAFGAITKIEVAQRVLFVSVAVALAFFYRSPWAIVIGTAVAAIIGYAAALIASGWRWAPDLSRRGSVFSGFSSQWWQGRLAAQMNYAVYPLLGGLLFSAEQVGLIVWALALTSVPALFAPLMGRAVFPTLANADPAEQMLVYRRLYKALLVVSLPGVAALFAFAEPITLFFFGQQWRDAIPIVRLECVTTALGVALTPAGPLLYLAADPRRVKWVIVLWAAAVWLLTPALAFFTSYYAPSIAQIAAAVVALVVFDALLRSARSYSIVAEMRASLVALVAAVSVGVLISGFADDRLTTIALGLAVAALQVALTFALRGGVDPRNLVLAFRRAEGSGGG
jgi:O-antigen/teichoic acid export membrane protein